MVIKMKKLYWDYLGDGIKEIETKEGKVTVAYGNGIYLVNDGKETFYADRVCLDRGRAVVRARRGEELIEYPI